VYPLVSPDIEVSALSAGGLNNELRDADAELEDETDDLLLVGDAGLDLVEGDK
jgi:hypothetical protein